MSGDGPSPPAVFVWYASLLIFKGLFIFCIPSSCFQLGNSKALFIKCTKIRTLVHNWTKTKIKWIRSDTMSRRSVNLNMVIRRRTVSHYPNLHAPSIVKNGSIRFFWVGVPPMNMESSSTINLQPKYFRMQNYKLLWHLSSIKTDPERQHLDNILDFVFNVK